MLECIEVKNTRSDELIMNIVEEAPRKEPYRELRLITPRGDVFCRFYPSPGSRRAAVWVGGVFGGWDTPARGLYLRWCEDLAAAGVASLRIRYRDPQVLMEAVHDVLSGIEYLESQGAEALALTGHSFGGAVVIQAAARSAAVRTVVTLATQAYGAEAAAQLGPRCSMLLLHGTADRVLPPAASEYVHSMAAPPKRLILLPGADHGLDQAAQQVYDEVRRWVLSELAVS